MSLQERRRRRKEELEIAKNFRRLKKLHKYKTSLWHCFRICNPECTLLNYDEGALWRRLVCRQTQDSISSIFTLILHLFLPSQFYYYSKAINKDVVLLTNTVWEINTSTFQTNQLKIFFVMLKSNIVLKEASREALE